MNKIATHDSATGERSKNFLHSLGKVFAQTQTKTIKEQYEAGVRYFDIRVDKDLVLCHGLWKADKDFSQLLVEMDQYITDVVYMRVIIERKYPQSIYDGLVSKIYNTVKLYCKNIKITYIAHKIPWTVLVTYNDIPVTGVYLSVPSIKEYFTRPYSNWKHYIPIPFILKMITPEVRFNDSNFIMVDFL